MAVPLEKFVKQLEDSGIILGETLKDFLPPTSEPKDAEELARDLIRKKKLTKFQAEEVSKGKGKSLVLGNYVLMEKIGAGGMGQVFKAEHRRMHRIVAIKVLPPNLTKDAASIARFEREVTAAAKISHPNIVAAHDADCANGVHFLVMELVEGSDLSALVKKNGPLSIEKSVNYVLQAARGLEAAHKKGIVHRDIKPANLLLDNEGIVKILDMGLARLSGDGDAPTAAELTSSGQIMGTVDYMAPEQALDTKTADARADIYALGCSLFYLLTGTATYEGDTIMQKLLAHRERPIPSLRSVRAEVSEPLEVVFKKMLAKKVEDRYQTMTEVVAALESCGRFKEETLDNEWSADVSNDPAQTALLEATSLTPTIATQTEKLSNKGKKRLLLIGAAVLGAAILAGLVVKLTTKDGTLIVTMHEPDAEVQVLTEDGTVEITKKGKKGTISISVDPGKHRLKVTKDGFTVFGQDFEIEAGGKQPITATLEPLEEKVPLVGTKPAPLAGEKKPLAFETPDFDQWVKEVAAMPAEQQVEAVSKKLVELNPEFDGKLTPTVEGDVVTGLAFSTDNVTDISPVRALAKLDFLNLPASPPDGGKLEDLSPLQGMKLSSLVCSMTRIADLSPLRGMPLGVLACHGTKISDLSPLSGIPLHVLLLDGSAELSDITPLKGLKPTQFTCGGSRVSDLSPLKDMKLTLLGCSNTKVFDLSPVKDMKLETLVCHDTLVNDLLPLKNMPLKSLTFNFKPERDTEVLRSIKTLEMINRKPTAEFWKDVEEQQKGKKLGFQMPEFDQWMKDVATMPAEDQVEAVSKKLQELNPGFDGKLTDRDGKGTPNIENGVVTALGIVTDHVTDISPVRALVGLTRLDCPGGGHLTGKLSDLSPLHGLPLTFLGILNTQVSDLSPLTKMPLTYLHCGNTPVSNLSPLEGAPLTSLICDGTKVTDLSPVRGMKLIDMSCARTNVSDLSPLQGMPLIRLVCFRTMVSNLSPLEGMHLGHLDIDNTQVFDLSPLQGMNLTEARITPTNITLGLDVIRQMESLKTLGIDSNNQWPPDEFWKKYDAGEFGKPTPQ